MKMIELPSKDGNFLINEDHIMMVEPFVFKGEQSIMITLAHPLNGKGTRKVNVDISYSDFEDLLTSYSSYEVLRGLR